MLHIPFDRTAKRTYSSQIYYGIRSKILSGELAVGEALPPYRELSEELGVSKNTVLTAYDLLVADGVLRGVAGSGFYVEAGVQHTAAPPPQRETPSAALTNRSLPEGTVNFDNGRPAVELFPRARWNKAVSAAMWDLSPEGLGYDNPQGRIELREALCGYLRRTQGIACRPEQILITSGAKQAITLAAGVLLAGNREVWMEDPAPALLGQMLACHTRRILPVPVDGHGLDPAAFPADRKPRLILCSPSRQFPTGAVLSTPRRIALIKFAERTGAYLLEDHFESEFRYEGPPPSSLYELAPERVLSVGTFSKVMYPSIRLGYLIAPPELLEPLCARKRLSDHHSNPVYQLALAAFLTDGTLERHIRRMQREYRARRDFLSECLLRLFGSRVRLSGGEGGMHLVAAFDGIRFTPELTETLMQHGVYATSVASQSVRKGQHENELILRYSGLSREELRLGAERLHAALSGS